MCKGNVLRVSLFFSMVVGLAWGDTKENPLKVMEKLEKNKLTPISISSVVATGNRVIQVQAASSNGCFNMGTASGITLTYQFPENPWSSHTNVFIDGDVYGNNWASPLNMSTYPRLVDSTIVCSWNMENIIIEQRLIPKAFSDSTGAILIEYVITNNDATSHDVGLLLELDTMINTNDNAPLFARDSYCALEKKFIGENIPDYYQAWERNEISNHGIISQGTLRGGEAVCPDLFIVGDWHRLVAVAWDYEPQDGGYVDSAVLLRWNSKRLSPGESRVVATYYGVGNVNISTGILSLAIFAPDRLEVVNNELSPNPFDVNVRINNSGSVAANNVEASLYLPAGLTLNNEAATKSAVPSTIQPGNDATVSWCVKAAVPARDTSLTITVVARSTNTDSNSVTKEIFIPTIQSMHDSIPIYPIADSPQNAGDEFWLDVFVGDSLKMVKDLYGVSFGLLFDSRRLGVVAPWVNNVVVGDFMGSTTDAIVLPPVIHSDTLSTSVYRKVPGTSVSGWGIVVRVKFKLKENTPDTMLYFRVIDSVALDKNGNPIYLKPKGFCITVKGWLSVWPGDTDNNGVVNQADMLPIGRSWNKTGYERDPILYPNRYKWESQKCRCWPEDERYTYADANGDSTVDELDVLAIGLNWHLKHEVIDNDMASLLELNGKGGIIEAVISERHPDHVVDISLEVKDVEKVLGMGVKLLYPAKEIKIMSVQSGDFWESSPLFIYRDDNSTGSVGIGLSRTRIEGGVSGSGCVAKIRLKAEIEAGLSEIEIGRVVGIDVLGNIFDFEIKPFEMTTGVEVNKNRTIPFLLYQNYPNPFNTLTKIKYGVPERSNVSIKVYDVMGNMVVDLVDEEQEMGSYEVVWEGRNRKGEMVSSGIYYFNVKAGQYRDVKKVLLLK